MIFQKNLTLLYLRKFALQISGSNKRKRNTALFIKMQNEIKKHGAHNEVDNMIAMKNRHQCECTSHIDTDALTKH